MPKLPTRVVLDGGKSTMPVNITTLPSPKTKRPPQRGDGDWDPWSNNPLDRGTRWQPGPEEIRQYKPDRSSGRLSQGAIEGGMTNDTGDYVMDRMPGMGGGPRGMMMDARINPDGSHQGRNSDNEFDEWKGGGPGKVTSDGARSAKWVNNPIFPRINELDEWMGDGGQLNNMLSDARGIIQGIEAPPRPRPPAKPVSPRSGGKPPQRPVRNIKKRKRLMPRKPRAANKNGGT